MFSSLSVLRHRAAQTTLYLALMALGLVALSHFGIDMAHAQLIDVTDSPDNITDATGGEGSFRTLARNVVNFFLYFLGFLATIMIIYGGFMYVTAGANEANQEKGKKAIMFAIIGIIVILLSFAIVNTVIGGAGTSDVSAT